MQEAEVSLRVALYYIRNKLTKKDVIVSIDGAQIKTGDKVHFDIWKFLNDNDCVKIDGSTDRWQGTYSVSGYSEHIVISSSPGMGDVNVFLLNGKRLYVESKKGRPNRSSQEYPLMREAIGQLMTSCELSEEIVPMVAVPFSEKIYELAVKWGAYPQIQQIGIGFLLVKEDGEIQTVSLVH